VFRISRLGRQRVAKQAVDISAVVHTVLDELGREHPDRHIEIRVSDWRMALATRRYSSKSL